MGAPEWAFQMGRLNELQSTRFKESVSKSAFQHASFTVGVSNWALKSERFKVRVYTCLRCKLGVANGALQTGRFKVVDSSLAF